jgi:hypothetical protein
LDIPFLAAMLNWPAGRRATDGVWAPSWYGAVEQSTGFQASAASQSAIELDAPLQSVADAAQPLYDRLKRYKLPACPS